MVKQSRKANYSIAQLDMLCMEVQAQAHTLFEKCGDSRGKKEVIGHLRAYKKYVDMYNNQH